MTRIIPADGKIIFDPETRQKLPPEGIEVETVSSFWIRREQDGDVSFSSTKRRAPRASK